MSRIGKKPIDIPGGVEVKKNGATITVKGPKGSLSHSVPHDMVVTIDKTHITVAPAVINYITKPLWGLHRQLINNMVVGVTQGYKKALDVVGVGYKAELKGNDLKLTCGYSSPQTYSVPKTIKVGVENATRINIEGIDKELVGMVASEIRAIRKPEPYKGKGIRYADEKVRQKAGKAAVK